MGTVNPIDSVETRVFAASVVGKEKGVVAMVCVTMSAVAVWGLVVDSMTSVHQTKYVPSTLTMAPYAAVLPKTAIGRPVRRVKRRETVPRAGASMDVA